MAPLLIKGGKVVNDDATFEADVYIEGGVIRQVGPNLEVSKDVKVINARGMLVIPGGIDAHTHMELPFMGTFSADDFYSGTRAALAGGTTMIIDFVIPAKNYSILQAYQDWRQKADSKVCCDYGLHVAITCWSDTVRHEMEILTTSKGVNSFKAFMAYKDMFQLGDAELLSMFETCRDLGALAMVHAENGDAVHFNQRRLLEEGVTGPAGHYLSRTDEVEAEATLRAITLANQVNAPLYVVHVMSNDAADIIAEKRKQGYMVFGEALAAGLGCDGTNYFNKCWRHAAAHIMSPPLRPDPSTPAHLMDKLSSGNLQTTGSDHCTFTDSQKALGKDDFTKIPNGVNGVEERMRVVWEKGVVTGKLDPCKFVEVTSTNAAKLFNIYPRKGRIAVGSDADLVVWDPSLVTTILAKSHHSVISFNIFEGMTCHGGPRDVITGGRVVMEGGKLEVERGAGSFVSTPTFNPQVFYKVTERERGSAQLRRSLVH